MRTEIESLFCIKQEALEGRSELLDFLRGAGMILVLLHHSDMPFGEWILAFHMPLLFVLSGYNEFLQKKTWRFWDYLKSKTLRLVIPYFAFEGINLFVWSASLIMQGGWQDLSEAALAIVSCLNTEGYTGYYGRLWFWPCLFVGDILFYFIKKICFLFKNGFQRNLCFSVFSLLLLIASWFTSKLLPYRLPFTADTALMAAFFLLVGYCLGTYISRLLDRKSLILDMLLLGIFFGLMHRCMHSGQVFCGMYENIYGDYGYTLVAALCGIFSFLIFTKWLYAVLCRIGLGKDLFLWYGRNSFVTFPVHLSIKIWIWKHIPWEYRPWYVLFAAMLLVNVPIVNFIMRYLPFLTGKFPARK